MSLIPPYTPLDAAGVQCKYAKPATYNRMLQCHSPSPLPGGDAAHRRVIILVLSYGSHPFEPVLGRDIKGPNYCSRDKNPDHYQPVYSEPFRWHKYVMGPQVKHVR